MPFLVIAAVDAVMELLMEKYRVKLMNIIENFKLFFEGALDLKGRSTSHIEAEADETMDQFLLLCFGDLLGVDMPTSYYALELLPYLGEDLEKWQRRMLDKKSVWEAKGAALDIDP